MRLPTLALLMFWPAMAAVNGVDPNRAEGNPSALVTIEVFSDFQCPACKDFHEHVLPQLRMDFVATGKVYLIYREFPLAMHPHSREAANYAVAAAHIGLYQPVADALFRDQVIWTANGKVWDTVAKMLTPSQQKKVKAAADDPSVLGEILRDMSAGHTATIQSTPTLLVSRDTRHFPLGGRLNYDFLRGLIGALSK